MGQKGTTDAFPERRTKTLNVFTWREVIRILSGLGIVKLTRAISSSV